MRIKPIALISIGVFVLLSCSKQKLVELPLIEKKGYGYLHSALGGISPYMDDENNPWKKTYLNVSGAPANWVDVKYGDIETNMYQSVYQNYLMGNISRERYEELQKSWDWKPDTLQLSKEPLKTKIAFAYGKDSTGEIKMILDANNNLDFSDDESFMPFKISPNENINRDSAASCNSINVTYERFTDNKKTSATAPLFIAFMSQFNIFMCNFPEYLVTNLDGAEIAVSSDGFTNLSYQNPIIGLLNDSLKDGDKIGYENYIAKNEFVEINGKLYKNIGVNRNRNTWILEKMNLPKNELLSSQIGYKSFGFKGSNFVTGSQISSDELRGKYVLLDFWAVWCGPCRMAIPDLKELYKKTDRDKFEIISIVGDSPTDMLDEMIKKDSITWPQILSTDSNKIKEAFGIHGYPTTFLLNPEGIIIAKNIGGKELEEKILGLIK